jgi:aspartate kinase
MIVMKFGGTSVQDAKAIQRVASIVEGRRSQKPVVVVSAMSKVTDSLIAMSSAAAKGDLKQALKIARQLRQRHFTVLAALATGELAEQTKLEIAALFESLMEVLRGVSALAELSPRSTDNILSFGEQLSSRLVTACFTQKGLNSVRVDSRECVLTDDSFTQAIPLVDATNRKLRSKLRPLLTAGKVPVMGGFISGTVDGIPTTLGRGGSDFSGAIIGAALGAQKIEIWTDVEGMMTTDPRLCPEAQTIDEISFDEAAELAFFGAKVLHPATLIPAVECNIPVYVLNSAHPEGKGTRIQAKTPPSHTMFRAIAVKKNVTVINVKTPRMLQAYGFLRALFEIFERHAISADLVSTSEISVSIVLGTKFVTDALVEDLKKIGSVDVDPGKAILCMVGENVKGQVGMAAQVFAAVAEGGINVHVISQGASEINIGLVIHERDIEEAVTRLHRHFFGRNAPLRKKPVIARKG